MIYMEQLCEFCNEVTDCEGFCDTTDCDNYWKTVNKKMLENMRKTAPILIRKMKEDGWE